MNDRAKQILIIMVAARLIPWVQKALGVTLSLEDVGDLFVAAVAGWHAGAASACMILKRFYPDAVTLIPIKPADPAQQKV
jgi:hypothetical protein